MLMLYLMRLLKRVFSSSHGLLEMVIAFSRHIKSILPSTNPLEYIIGQIRKTPQQNFPHFIIFIYNT